MKSPQFANLLSDLACNEKFRTLCRLSDDAVLKQQHMEYATRLICHAFVEFGTREDLNEYLDRAIMHIVDTYEPDQVESVFLGTVGSLYDACGPDALLPEAGKRIFTLRGLESILVGIARNLDEINELPDAEGFIRQRVSDFWSDETTKIFTSSGMSAGERVLKTVPLGITWFSPSKP